MHGIRVDALRKIGADGARRSFLRISRAHQLTVLGNGALAFQHLDHDRAGHHEINQILEEGALFVHSVKAFSFGTGQPSHTRGHNLEAIGFKAGLNFADHILGNGGGLDDG